MVRKITLSDGKQIQALAFGTGSFGHLGFHEQSVADGVRALEAGFRHLDTAQMYETERAIAESIKQSGLDRDEVFVTTKLSDNVLKESTPEAIRAAVQSSLDNLGFKPDSFLIHNPFVIESGKLGAAWQVLESLVEDGTLAGTSLGVSNFRTQDLEEILAVAKIKPVINQMEYHPFILAQNAANGLDALQREHGITYQAYGPLAPILRLPKDKSPLTPVLDRIAERLSKDTGKSYDPAAVLLLWNIANGVPVVTTSGNPERIKAIADLDGAPDLSAEEINEINEAGKTFHFRYYSEHMTKDYPQPDLPTTGNSRVEDVKQWFGKDITA